MPKQSEGSAFKPKDRNSFRIKFKDEDGKWKWEGGFKTRGAARTALTRRNEEITKRKELRRLGVLKEHDTDAIPIHQLLLEFLSVMKDNQRNESYIKEVARTIGEVVKLTRAKCISDLTIETLGKGIAAYGEARSTTTRNKARAYFSQFFAWLKKADRWEKNPCDAIPILKATDKRRKRTLSQEELERFYAACPEKRAVIYEFVANTGLRRNAARTLLWEDVNMVEKFISIRDHKNKNKKELRIPLNSVAFDILERIRPRKNITGKAKVFPKSIPTKETLRKDLGAAGIEVRNADGIFTFHSLRKQVATDLIKSGQNPKIAQDILGHKDLKTTLDVYTDIEDGDKRGALEDMVEYRKNKRNKNREDG